MTTPSFFNRAEETRFAANPRPEYLFDCEIEHVRSSAQRIALLDYLWHALCSHYSRRPNKIRNAIVNQKDIILVMKPTLRI